MTNFTQKGEIQGMCVCVEHNGGEMGEGGQQTQTSCYKIYKPWGYDTQHDHYGQ